jgi:alkylation response protein AidB-like acyl-CoA dehydrogenase
VKTSGAGLGLGDALLAGGAPRSAGAPRPRVSARYRRLRPRLDRLLARVDGDAIDRADRVPASTLAELRRIGAFRMILPRAFGGLGLSHADYHDAVARLAARSVGLSMWVTTHQSLGAAALVAASGTAEQRADLLPRMAAGELAALAATEEGAGTDPTLAAATARPARGGAYRLDGLKLWVSNGPVARWIAVLARAPGGLTLFVVDARARGVRVERRCRFLGLRGLENGVVRLRGVVVPASRRLGAEGDGLRLLLSATSGGRLTIAPRALGLARECLRAAREWAARRRQRGRPLADEPDVAARLRRLDALVGRLEAVSARAAQWADAGKVERTDSALAKLFAAAAAWEAADSAVQLRGGRGYETADSQRARGEAPVPAERWLRDARGLRLIEGTDDALRWAVARRGLELARAGVRAPRAAGALGRRAALLGAEFRALARGTGAEVPARALELADEAARLLAAAC